MLVIYILRLMTTTSNLHATADGNLILLIWIKNLLEVVCFETEEIYMTKFLFFNLLIVLNIDCASYTLKTVVKLRYFLNACVFANSRGDKCFNLLMYIICLCYFDWLML